MQVFLIFRSFFRSELEIDLGRLSAAMNFSREDCQAGSFDKSIELVFVSIKKDFPVLVESIKFAKMSIRDYQFGGVRVIVPDVEVTECEALISQEGLTEIYVIPESTLISPDSLVSLRSIFGKRTNWVLQQILKVQAVLASSADASLIVDSDTLLLSKRAWFNANGGQLLTPSHEYNPPYYYFLEKLGISDQNPKYTFISHHMLMQRSELEKTFQSLEWSDEGTMVEYICQNARAELESPICIEYELYAQSLLKRSPEKVHLGLWSNVSISRSFLETILKSKFISPLLTRCFYSASLHSWSVKSP